MLVGLMPGGLTVGRRTLVGLVRTVERLGGVTGLLGCAFRLRRLGEGRPYPLEETFLLEGTYLLVVVIRGVMARLFTAVSGVMVMVGRRAWTAGVPVESG